MRCATDIFAFLESALLLELHGRMPRIGSHLSGAFEQWEGIFSQRHVLPPPDARVSDVFRPFFWNATVPILICTVCVRVSLTLYLLVCGNEDIEGGREGDY